MKLAGLVVLAACGSSSEPAPTSTPVAAVPPDAPVAVKQPEPPNKLDVPVQPAATQPVDLIAKLPEVKPAYAKTDDAAVSKKATALNAEGVVFHGKKDYAKAEEKFVAALAADPGHAHARYNLACVYNLTGRSDRGLAHLAQLRAAEDCEACNQLLARARYDEDWRSQWDQTVFWQLALDILGEEIPQDFECAPGTRKVTAKKRGDDSIEYCAKGNVKHGPYRDAAFLVHMGEGSAIEEGRYENGVQTGIWSHRESYGAVWHGGFDDAGNKHGLWMEGDHKTTAAVVYVHGVREGRTFSEHEGHLDFEGGYKAGKLHGPAKHYLQLDYDRPETLYVESAGDYLEGKKHGRWTTWNDAKEVVTDGTYQRGVEVGTWRTYAAGSLIMERSYDTEGKRHGTFTYWVGGKAISTTMDHGSGDWISYENGVLREQGHLTKGVRDGAWRTFEDERSGEGTYTAGLRTGAWVFSRGVAKAETGNYTAGQRTGEWTLWHENGKPLAKGSYVADKREGAWTYWSDAGDVIAKGAFKAGQLDKTWELYQDDTRILKEPIQTLVFRAGKLVTVNGERSTKQWEYGVSNVRWEVEPRVINSIEQPPF